MRATRKMTWIVLIISSLGFISFVIGLSQSASWLKSYDTWGIQLAHGLSSGWQAAFRHYTVLGNGLPTAIYTLLIGLVLWLKRQKRAVAYLLVNMVIFDAFINWSVKQLIQRPRPTFWRLIPISGYSFPSGHATNATILLGTLIVLGWQITRNQSIRWLGSIVAVALILGILISRVVVGVHYPSDVTAGCLYGIAVLALTNLIFKQPLIIKE